MRGLGCALLLLASPPAYSQEHVTALADVSGTVTTLPTLLNQALEVVTAGIRGAKVNVTYKLQIDDGGPDGPVDFSADVHGVRGTDAGANANLPTITTSSSTTTFIYRLQVTRASTNVSAYLPVRVTLSRGDSVYQHMLQACPEYREQKLCSLIAHHVNRAFYGVEYAPSHPAAAVEDFTASRTTVLRYLAARYGYRRYLEIGVEYSTNFDQLRCVSDPLGALYPWPADIHGSRCVAFVLRCVCVALRCVALCCVARCCAGTARSTWPWAWTRSWAAPTA